MLSVPWLAILGLMALKPNRHAMAWLIWLPLGAVFAFSLAPSGFLSPDFNFLMDIAAALGFGLAAVWLLSNYLQQRYRILTFLCVGLAMAVFSGLAFISKAGLDLTGDMFVAAIGLAIGIGAGSVALAVAGLICRRRYRPFGIYAWLLGLLAVIWVLIAAPIYIFETMGTGGTIDWREFFVPVLLAAVLQFAVLLPFLILSSATPFFRERFKGLLNFKPEAPPVAGTN